MLNDKPVENMHIRDQAEEIVSIQKEFPDVWKTAPGSSPERVRLTALCLDFDDSSDCKGVRTFIPRTSDPRRELQDEINRNDETICQLDARLERDVAALKRDKWDDRFGAAAADRMGWRLEVLKCRNIFLVWELEKRSTHKS